MQRVIEDIWSFLFDGGLLEILLAFLDSTFFFVVKVLIGIYVTILLVNIILLIYLGDLKSQMRALRRGTSYQPTNEKDIKRKWKKITKRLEDDNENEWKVAVLEADDIVNNYLAEEGHHGDTFSERLAQLPQDQEIDTSLVEKAHGLRNTIIRDESREVEIDEAEEAVDAYYAFLEDLGVV